MTAADPHPDTAIARRHLDGGSLAVGPLAHLVRVAVDLDDPARLVAAAALHLGQPLGAADGRGEPLGHAPGDLRGRRALAHAAAAARGRAAPPPGWRVVPVVHAGARVAFLASGDRGGDLWRRQLLELVATLLGDQLARASLRRGQAAAFIDRLVGEPGLAPERARREAAAAGVPLADRYWVAVLACFGDDARAELAGVIGRASAERADGRLTATADGHVVLLHPDGGASAEAVGWFERVVERVRAAAPSARAHAIAAQAPTAIGELAAQVSLLLRLGRFGPRAEPARPVVWASRYALDRLLWENVATPEARGFVDERLGALMAWDREHGSDLLHVLEAALDFPRHDHAARRCFMHRNTFRHRLRQATGVLGDDLEDPDIRLAVHVALKLRRGLPPAGGRGARGGAPATPAGARRAARPRHPR